MGHLSILKQNILLITYLKGKLVTLKGIIGTYPKVPFQPNQNVQLVYLIFQNLYKGTFCLAIRQGCHSEPNSFKGPLQKTCKLLKKNYMKKLRICLMVSFLNILYKKQA